MNKLLSLIVFTVLFNYTSAIYAGEAERIALIDYQKAQDVMAHRVNPMSDVFWTIAEMGPFGEYIAYFKTASSIYAHRDKIREVTTEVYKTLFNDDMKGDSPKDDVAKIKEIIESGRKNNVDEMEINISKEQSVELKATLPIPDATVVTFGTGVGGKDTFSMKIKFNKEGAK